MAIVVPVFFAAAIAVLPSPPPDPQFNRYLPAALPEVVTTSETDAFTIRRRINRLSGEQQLEIIVRQPLTVPAALVYVSPTANGDLQNSRFVGSLTSKGEHRFALGNALPEELLRHVVLFNPIKNKVILIVDTRY